MNYKVIILGATWLATGLAEELGNKCLIIERRPQAGYEYLNAMKWDSKRMFDSAVPLYKSLKRKNVLLQTEVVSVRKEAQGYEVVTHGVSGFRTWHADSVIDTRPEKNKSISKSLNILVSSGEDSELKVLRCPVSLKTDYAEARKIVAERIAELPKGNLVIHIADMFEYEMDEAYVVQEDGVILMASCAFDDPWLALESGARYVKERMS